MQETTQQYLMARGRAAQSLLDHPAFSELKDQIIDDMSRQIVNTEPKDHELRKQLYYTVGGMKAFLGVLVAYVSVADAIVAQLERDNNPTDEPF